MAQAFTDFVRFGLDLKKLMMSPSTDCSVLYNASEEEVAWCDFSLVKSLTRLARCRTTHECAMCYARMCNAQCVL